MYLVFLMNFIRMVYAVADLQAALDDVQPSSPAPAAGESTTEQSSISLLPLDVQKFLRFAETHRVVLNQILRQSTVPLSEGPFAVLVDHTRVLDFDVKRKYFRHELERIDAHRIRREDVALRIRRAHIFEDSFRGNFIKRYKTGPRRKTGTITFFTCYQLT